MSLRVQLRLDRGAQFSLWVDATLAESGVTAVFGASGSGKTTLLRCIAGLERGSSGTVQLNETLWQDGQHFVPTHRRDIGYVFQEHSLLPHLSAEGNLRYARKRAGKTITAREYDAIVETLGIGALLVRKPAALSGGERQRVAIARALVLQPRLLLMDEPLSSLDAARKREILPYLERLRQDVAIPILYVSHSLDEVARLADDVLVLEQGRVAAHGPVAEVFARTDLPLDPAEEPGVVLNCKVLERDNQWHLARAGFVGGELWLRDGGDVVGAEVRVRVQARDVSIALSRAEDSSVLNRLPAQVESIEPAGDVANALVLLRCGDAPVLARLTQRSVTQLGLRPGLAVWAQIKSVALVR